MNIPNRLTLIRLMFVPVIVFFAIFPFAQFNIVFGYIMIDFVSVPIVNIIILVLFLIASITDFFDGYIARKQNLVTTFGKFVDTLADKLLVNTMFIIFAYQGIMPLIAVLIMIWRDTIIEGVRMIAARNGVTIAAAFLGKVKTVTQMITIVLFLVSNLPFELVQLPIHELMLWFTVSISVVSGISYFLQAKDLILESM
ncbi:MAG: CDP-diacylglycerol--glycerol-3-phosphate 3-phosphatidyltransferase [Ignavibacteria bacterium]|nr:CDP-diacylglycerol--glycerol-3-phosphate 3-phosphatidyltransferase [Ignavibacteria bacterium]